jgi:hypothetical protein
MRLAVCAALAEPACSTRKLKIENKKTLAPATSRIAVLLTDSSCFAKFA